MLRLVSISPHFMHICMRTLCRISLQTLTYLPH